MGTRREWLEKFVELCDSGAKTVEFRRHCRIKAQHLPRHVRKLAQYRAELAPLMAEENEQKRQEEIKKGRLKALEEARRVRAEQAAERLAALRAAQEVENSPNEEDEPCEEEPHEEDCQDD
jgi:hypothetical protein